MNTDLIKYYKNRAKEYENIYLKPERQSDLESITSLLQDLFADKTVLEIACGTGFWTEKIAQTATSVLATDINEAVIEIAQQKQYIKNNVTFGLEDIFKLSNKNKYEGIFGGFIWSHIKLQDINRFLEVVNNSAKPGGMVVFLDNNYVEGSSNQISQKDEDGNTFQTRKLDNGTSHLILKNFPTESSLREKLADVSTDLKFINLKYYWLLSYRTKIMKGKL